MINESSEAYRPAASRGALVYFLMSELYKIHSFYKFSLNSFVIVIKRAIDLVQEADRAAKEALKANKDEDEEEEEQHHDEDEEEGDKLEMTPKTLAKRVLNLTESITF